ncbi:regulator of G-protein signaling 9a isoform X2 [Anguilla anguilla]|uniref:regulator of G-protein signaling 9a isoform X2 n=1 Tax=Anguilla anguilla TaxID=7936 RepID=UPI0015ADCD26|nr:regulator of G-protein signaling 9a isoform X2 [Anguilla anguilla]
MTIRTNHDHGQHYRPRMACLKKVDALVVEMQDPKNGVKFQEQKLVITTIPHAMTGQDIHAWIVKRLKVTPEEAGAFGTMLVAYGYIYPLQNHKKLVLKGDSSLYRFQTPYFWPAQKWPMDDTNYAIYLAKRNIRKKGVLETYEQEHYNHLHKWMNHKWDFIVLQAKEQHKAGKERKKPDRVVFDCQERAYWIVHKPPPRTFSAMDYGLDRHIDPNEEEKKSIEHYRRIIIFVQQYIMRSRTKSTVSLGALVKFVTTYKTHDPFLAPCLPSNPWLTDDSTYWELNMPNAEIPTQMRVEHWTFSFYELLNDPRGRADFWKFLKKEFSGENLAFWEAAEEMKWGTADSMKEKAESIYKTFLAPGAPRWINIDQKTMAITVKGLDHPHRYVLDAAQTHIFMLMKKDTYGRYLKSPVFKDTQKKALNPEAHNFSDAQLEQNARNRRPGIHPIILWQQAEEEKAKIAAATKQAQVSHLALCSVHWQTALNRVHLSSSPARCSSSSSFSAATDAPPTPRRDRRGNGGPAPTPPPPERGDVGLSEALGAAGEASGPCGEFRKPTHRRRMTLALHPSPSPKCAPPQPACTHADAEGGQRSTRPRPRTIALFFPNEEDDAHERLQRLLEERREAARVTMQEVVCPWESANTQSYFPR